MVRKPEGKNVERVIVDEAALIPDGAMEHVVDPERVAEIRQRARGRDYRDRSKPLTPAFKRGEQHPSGGTVIASFPGMGAFGLSLLEPEQQRAATRNMAAAIYHQFNVAQIITWTTQPRKGRKRGRYTVHYVETCPALRRAKHAKMIVYQRQEVGLPFENGCLVCERLEAEETRRREQREALERLRLPAPEVWDEIDLYYGQPRWIVVSSGEPVTIEKAQEAVRMAFERERLPHPESIERQGRENVDPGMVYVMDRQAFELPQSARALPPGS